MTALMIACSMGNWDIIQMLVEDFDADLDGPLSLAGMRAIDYAAFESFRFPLEHPIVEYLKSKGSNHSWWGASATLNMERPSCTLALMLALSLAVSSQGLQVNHTVGTSTSMPNGCGCYGDGQIVSWAKIGETKDNCGGEFTIAMADRPYMAPMSGQPFMVGGQRRRQTWYCGGVEENSDCGGGNCMKAHTNDRRRFKLECGNCVCNKPLFPHCLGSR
jgi:hypothetical protein